MSVTFPLGFSASGVVAGISSIAEKKDLAVIVNNGPQYVAAGVFTSNRFAAAPVQWSRKIVQQGVAKAVVVNSGGANACTGDAGYAQSQRTAEELAQQLDVVPTEVLVCSTGLIGELLPLDNVLQGVHHAVASLDNNDQAGVDASEAIMTTDTKPKRVEITSSQGYKIGGMVKGSGMIAPQLATMIAVITTDAVVTSEVAQRALRHATAQSFDRIDVDGCMSTNDTVLLLASGASQVVAEEAEFTALVQSACKQLARQIIGDGEGASHDIHITVEGATSEDAALACARAVAASNLFKCAVAGNDPNWGRIVSSIGVVPEDIAPYDPSQVSVTVNGVQVCDGGEPDQPRSLVDMSPREVDICINLHAGQASADVWTDDLTLDYVHINADYES